MIKLYLQNQDEKPILVADEFFEILEETRVRPDIIEEVKESEIEIHKHLYQLEEKAYNVTILKDISLDTNYKTSKSISVLPFMRSHIIYCFAIPSEVSLREFLQIIEKYQDDLKFVRVIYELKEKDTPPPYYSLILYFTGQIAADNFYQEFNCEVIGPQDEVLYLLFVSKIIYMEKEFEAYTKNDPDILETSIQLPKCPLCIEKLDGSITGIYFEMMKKFRNYDKEERWAKLKENCKICNKIKRFSQIENDNQTKEAKCQTCGFVQNNWICLICGNIGCGRYNSAHAHDHFQSTYHNFALELDSLRIWDYLRDTYVHRIVRSKEYIVLNLPDNDERESVNQKVLNDRMEAMIWEYNYLLSTQLEEQRKYYEDKVAEVKKKKEDSPKYQACSEKIRTLKNKRDQLQSKIEEYDKEAKMFVKKIKMIKDKNESLKQEIEQLNEFNTSIKENINTYSKPIQQKEERDEEIEREKEKLESCREKLNQLISLLE